MMPRRWVHILGKRISVNKAMVLIIGGVTLLITFLWSLLMRHFEPLLLFVGIAMGGVATGFFLQYQCLIVGSEIERDEVE